MQMLLMWHAEEIHDTVASIILSLVKRMGHRNSGVREEAGATIVTLLSGREWPLHAAYKPLLIQTYRVRRPSDTGYPAPH